MSIIYEALKKLENKTPPFKENKKKNIFLIPTIISFLLGSLVYFYYSNFKKIEKKPDLINTQFKRPEDNINKNPNNLDTTNNVPKYRLEGIIFDKERPIALINKKRLTVGDTIDDAKVLRIDQNMVELEINDKKEYLILE